jgi:hypothetical protein
LLFLIALAVSTASCTGLDPRPGPIRAMEPRPDAPVSRIAAPARPAASQAPDMQRRLRQHRWLTQFWDALTPAQQRRVAARMRLADDGATEDVAGVQRRWDVMGLAERAGLVFGTGAIQPATRPSPALATDVPGEGATGS